MLKNITHATYLAGQNIAKGREGVIQCLVVNRLIHVLDEDVSHTRLPQSWVTLRPHYSDRTAFDNIKVHCIQGTLRFKDIQQILLEENSKEEQCQYIRHKGLAFVITAHPI